MVNLNKLIARTELAEMPLGKIIAAAAGKPDRAGILNSAAQVWKHTFYWRSLRPHGGGEPPVEGVSAVTLRRGPYIDG